MFPKRFQYLSSVAEKYGIDDVQVNIRREPFMDSLTPAQLAELGEIYKEIERRGDAYAISEWLDSFPLGTQNQHDYRRMWLLFMLFDHLEKRGIQPFASGKVYLYEMPKPPLD